MGIDRSVRREGSQLGRYRLLRLLGRGGMGEVWLAEDSELSRQVAIKLLLPVLANEQEYLNAFRYEARAAAALDHPHILPIHDFGEQRQEEDEVITYLVMPYIAGGTLRDWLHAAQGPLPVEEALDYLSQAAQAIDYAHQHGVLHRDIKPANMLLQDTWLLLADFGIAKLLTTATYRNQTHSGAGTPEYMAPEQIQKMAVPASDRYSLGIVAYQLFSGRLPFQADTPLGVLFKHLREMPPPPRRFNPALPQAVEAALLQGIARNPDERPVSCAAFVAALQAAWRTGPLMEEGDPEATLLAPWSKYRAANVPTQREAPAISLPGQGEETEHTPDDAMTASTHEPIPAKLASQEIPQQKILFRRRALLIGGVAATAVLAGGGTLAALLHRAPAQKEQQGTPSSPVVIQSPGPQRLMPGVPLLSLNGHTEPTHSAEWDPTGRYLATGGDDSRLMLWDITTALANGNASFHPVLIPQHTWTWKYLTADHKFCWSADGRNIIVAEGIWMLDPFKNPDHPSPYNDLSAAFPSQVAPEYDSLAWQPGSDHFAASLFVNTPALIAVEIWSRSQPGRSLNTLRYTGSFSESLTAHTIVWSPDGNLLAAYLALETFPTDRSHLVVWHAASGQVRQVISFPPPGKAMPNPPRTPLVWSPVEANLLAFGNWNNVVVWDVQRDTPLLTLSVSDAQEGPQPAATFVLGLAWSPDGRYLVGCYGSSRRIYIWDIASLRRAAPSPDSVQYQALFFPTASGAGHSQQVSSVSWSPDGRYIASTSADKTVIVWLVDGSVTSG